MKVIFYIIGIVSFFAAYFMIDLGGSLFSDYGTENPAGAGVDIYLKNKFITPESEFIHFEVWARGGSKAGINYVSVYHGNESIATEQGDGADWGRTISSKGRGNERVSIKVPMPVNFTGNELPLSISTSYVYASSSGSSYFTNEREKETHEVIVPVYSKGSAWKALFPTFKIPVISVLSWIILTLLVIMYIKHEYGTFDEFNHHGGEDSAYPILGLYVGLSVIGYFSFARLLAFIVGFATGWMTFLFMLVWLGIPVLIAWRMSKSME